MLNNKKSIFLGCEGEYQNSNLVLFGAGFDGTTTYRPGTRFAPSRMREESYGLETYSPYLDKDLTDYNIFDAGDIELQIGDTNKCLAQIYDFTREIVQDNKMPIMIGGEHLVTLPAFRAVHDKYKDMYVLHFDAHADLRNEYLGVELSHSTVMRRVSEIVGKKRIFQFGIRSGERDEFIYAQEHTVLNKFNLNGIDKAVKIIGNKPVYLSIDLDVLDPSVFPATGTPESGGVSFNDLTEALDSVQVLNIVAADVNELSPPYDSSGASTMVACKVLRELLLILAE